MRFQVQNAYCDTEVLVAVHLNKTPGNSHDLTGVEKPEIHFPDTSLNNLSSGLFKELFPNSAFTTVYPITVTV